VTERTNSERRKAVFVVHGRNADARQAMFDFLGAIGLRPIEWSQARELTGEPNPYISKILDAAFSAAQAIIVLFTPDEIVRLRPEYADGVSDPELSPGTQARPNVLFEAGMAMGRNANRTVLVELGQLRSFSDIMGRHALRMSGETSQRLELAQRLKSAGCEVDLSGQNWLHSGNFVIPGDPQYFPSEHEERHAGIKPAPEETRKRRREIR
jgi:predicted nucleotide-binding protein